MALYFFVLLTLLKFAACLPDPNVKVDIDVRVDDNGCCPEKHSKPQCKHGVDGTCREECEKGEKDSLKGCEKDGEDDCDLKCCVEDSKPQCKDGVHGTCREECEKGEKDSLDGCEKDGEDDCDLKCCVEGCKNGTIIDSCLEIQCINEILVYQKTIFSKCATCYGWGDPHFVAFENHKPSRNYNFYGVGTYVMTQQGLTAPTFGVTSTFKKCGIYSCIESATYYEPGLKIVLEAKNANNEVTATVHVNKKVLTGVIPKIVKERTIDVNGNVYYIFDAPHIPFRGNNLNCINIVGSKGISVSLCVVAPQYTLLYIWLLPVPSLMNQVYGLCDRYTGTYTGTTLNSWMDRFELPITFPSEGPDPAIDTFAATWSVSTEADINTVAGVNKRSISVEHKCTDATVNATVKAECEQITADACGVIPYWECKAFTESCVFDLCQFSNHTSYAQGYAGHMLIHQQLATPDDMCLV